MAHIDKDREEEKRREEKRGERLNPRWRWRWRCSDNAAPARKDVEVKRGHDTHMRIGAEAEAISRIGSDTRPDEGGGGGGQRGRGKHGTDGVMVEGVGIMRGRHTGRANG